MQCRSCQIAGCVCRHHADRAGLGREAGRRIDAGHRVGVRRGAEALLVGARRGRAVADGGRIGESGRGKGADRDGIAPDATAALPIAVDRGPEAVLLVPIATALAPAVVLRLPSAVLNAPFAVLLSPMAVAPVAPVAIWLPVPIAVLKPPRARFAASRAAAADGGRVGAGWLPHCCRARWRSRQTRSRPRR